MAETSFDLIILGGGPGGYVAAIRAAQLGMNTCLVEREHLGGICLNWGCIPTKTLLRSADLLHDLGRLKEHGLAAGKVSIDLAAMVARSRGVAERLNAGVRHLLKKNKVTVFEGSGALAGKDQVAVSGGKDGDLVLSAPRIILATGARARDLPGLEADGKLVWTYKEAMVPETLPKTLLVIGSGAIGMEFASFYRDLGAEVTVVEVLDRILPQEDEEISGLAAKAFAARGLTLHTGATVTGMKKTKTAVTAAVDFGGGKSGEIKAERVILAVGIVGNVEGIGLEEAGVKVEKAHVVTNQWSETSVPGVYAIGDLTGPPWLAHKASHEGVACVEHMAGEEAHALEVDSIPACTYCRPQVASIGLTEAAALAAGHQVRVGRFPYAGNGKAIALGEPDGLVKTVFDADTGELLGAHMIGAEVTELIQGFAIAKTLETTEAELMRTVFPHPTLSEMMHESVLDAYGRAIHF